MLYTNCSPPDMTTEQFVQGFYRDKQSLLELYFNKESGDAVATHLQGLNLTEEQQEAIRQLLDIALTDVYYSVLLGLEGSASIGGVQTRYQLFDNEGNTLNDGDIGGYAWQYFQNDGLEEE
ncbi:hypothetical protein MTX78_13930 [Hymenobacter tibetensis]|uniref:Uncharacterized protein n=1 Tax=Hymenobacter tibetensis TaxID=497967 RepID=A0ABY4CZX0_9BACT|nr:hypothetical protein [Hymenobacter tibetensis]UOG73223.1 hypothetical protein MTX78_13930 [Hymenobacter tibetensis]